MVARTFEKQVVKSITRENLVYVPKKHLHFSMRRML